MLQQHQKIYEQLHLFYRRLLIYDIETYSPQDLKSLTVRLQNGLNLDEKEQKIHEQLIKKSQHNVEKRLREKHMLGEMKKDKNIGGNNKKNNEINKNEKIFKKQAKFFEIKDQQEDEYGEYVNQSAIIGDFIMPQPQVVKIIQGKIYEGMLLIILTIDYPQKDIHQSALFQIVSDLDDSTINAQTLAKLSIPKTSSQLELIIQKKSTSVKYTQNKYNTIGLKYLRANNIITKCNFRTDSYYFSMIFTQ